MLFAELTFGNEGMMMNAETAVRKINAGKARSMDVITAALFELLENRAFSNITVTDICAKAKVARKTFYRNFPTKTSVVERLVDQVFYDCVQKYDFKTVGARKIYQYWYEYILCTREFSAIFFDPDLYRFIVGKIREFVEIEINETLHSSSAFDPMHTDYYLNFAAAGIAAIMKEWMKNDCQTPPKTMAVMTARLLSGVII